MLIKDANGKEFNVELQDFMHFTTDSDIEKNKGFSVADSDNVITNKVVTEIVDSKGNKVDISKLFDDSKNKPEDVVKALDVTFEATHSGNNRNYSTYHSDSMEKDMESWMNPFPKPFIKNHDSHSEPLGRVKNFSFGQSEFNPDRDCINVTYRVTDKDAIPKFLDGRYKTMSIGGNAKNITCNICGKTILKDNAVKFCGHWRGETYNNQTCYWNFRDVEYVEGSVVNNPADDWALVKKIIVNPDDNSSNDSVITEPNNIDSKDNIDMQVNVLDNIDDLTKKENVKEVNEDKTEGAEGNTEDSKVEENKEPETVEDDTKKLNEKITELEDEVKTLKASNDELSLSITDLNSKLTEANTKVDSLTGENKTVKDQNVELANFSKNLMAQRIVDYQIFNSEILEDDRETKVNELVAKTAVELDSLNKDLKINKVKPKVAKITTAANPSLANIDDGVTVADDNKNLEDKEKTPTLKDLEESVINVFTRTNGYKKEEI